jgi:hypothetical protein
VDWGYREKPCCIIVFCSVCFEHRWGVQVYDERGEEIEESDNEATTPVPSKTAFRANHDITTATQF